jgi:hypothetical protein
MWMVLTRYGTSSTTRTPCRRSKPWWRPVQLLHGEATTEDRRSRRTRPGRVDEFSGSQRLGRRIRSSMSMRAQAEQIPVLDDATAAA